MNALTFFLVLGVIGYSNAFLFPKCETDDDCSDDKCCIFGKRCIPRLPEGTSCNFKEVHGCGCALGTSCQVTVNKTLPLSKQRIIIMQCVKDEAPVVPEDLNDTPNLKTMRARRVLIRKCSSDQVAEDCGKSRCCIGGKYCSPLLPKYFPCNFEDSHKCECDTGLECKVTKTVTVPWTPISLSIKQCMPIDENVEDEKIEMN